MKDSAFLGVRLGDGLKLETSALGLRTKVVTVIMLLALCLLCADALFVSANISTYY